MSLPDAVPGRKQQFLASLKLAGLTVAKWCDLHNITPGHLYFVLDGDRIPGEDLSTAIDATITKYLRPASSPDTEAA